MLTQVQRLARYASRATFEDLSPASRTQLPVHILDCLGCCIAALGEGPVRACQQQVIDFGGTGPCALIGDGKANPVYAAFWHTVLVRYVDFMDNFLAPTETCHTADNFGVALTAADYVGGSGRDLMLGPAKITVRLQDGTIIEHGVQDYPGMPSRPFTWEDSVEKFDRLVAGRVDDSLRQEIKEAVRTLDGIQVKDPMGLLGRVQVSR